MQEIPGGKVDSPDVSILHAAARELREEAGLRAMRVVRKVGEIIFSKGNSDWVKLVFEMEVEDNKVVHLDPLEHQDYLWASKEEVMAGKVGDVELQYVSDDIKRLMLEAFVIRHEAATL